ncbi:MAG: YidC/Oxa1 family membrane protein insertase [Candidatus Dojkabacteria bacterium]
MENDVITGFLYIEPLFQLAYNILMILYRFTGNNLGLAIILFTLALRLSTLPLSFKQIKNAKKSKEFQSKYKELKEQYKDDEEKLAKELAQLQAQYLPGQIGGCLPLILQLLFFIQIFYVIRNAVEIGPSSFNLFNYSFVPEFSTEKVFNLEFLGLNLGQAPLDIGFDSFNAIWPYLILVALVGLGQFIASKVSLELAGVGNVDEDKDGVKDKVQTQNNREDKKKEGAPDEYSFAEAMQQSMKQMIYILPIMTMGFSLGFPAGLSLYWSVSSGFAIIQQLIIKRESLENYVRTKLGKDKQGESTADKSTDEDTLEDEQQKEKEQQKNKEKRLKRKAKKRKSKSYKKK